jgi:hypothetical protein
MKFTIFVEGPFDKKIDRSKLTLNSAGQFVVFDGKSTRLEIENCCAKLAPHCECVVAFTGKNIGRLIVHWHKGKQLPILPDFKRCSKPQCSYCGGIYFSNQKSLTNKNL